MLIHLRRCARRFFDLGMKMFWWVGAILALVLLFVFLLFVFVVCLILKVIGRGDLIDGFLNWLFPDYEEGTGA